MINNNSELIKVFDNLLKPYSFIRKKDSWYLHTDECIVFFTFGKNDLSTNDHLLGGFIKELMEPLEMYPKYYKNHIKYSLDNFEDTDINKTLFNIEYRNYSENQRELIIETLFKKYAIPFLLGINSKEGIKNSLQKYPDLKYYFLNKPFEVFKLLGVEID